MIFFNFFLLLIFLLFVSSELDSKIESKDVNQKMEKSDVEDDKVNESISKIKEPSKTDDEVVKREEEAIAIDGLNVSQIKELREKAEKYAFKTEVDRMMKLIINSLYKNKDIFLRELISNASDALDKIRFISLTNSDISHDNDDLLIRIKADKVAKTLHIQDTGIGMTKEELINNLGTIAKSGTNEFFSKASESKSRSELTDLIGQFGVGFYSSFLVADRVTVVSKSDAGHQHIWESDSSSFSVSVDPRGNTLKRGTEIILHLKEEAHEYLEAETLDNLVHKYSQFINFPIYLWKSVVRKVEDPQPAAVSKRDDDASIDDDNDKKTVEKTVWDWDLINKSKPIWTRKTGEITEEEYNEFFKSFSKETNDPIAKTHFTAEGEVSFKAILYVPKVAPSESSDHSTKKNDNIKMYVKRVFITDTFDDLMPKYLEFIKGIVDSDDLPLNVSRETLQQHKLLKVIKKKLIRKTLDMFKKMPEDIYKQFWSEYGSSIKLGAMEDVSNRNRLAKLLRFSSSNSDEELTSLSDYMSRMKANQDKIYFIAGNSINQLKSSPLVETLLSNSYEVLYLTNTMDEYTLQSIPEFEGKKFQNVAKEGFKLHDDEKLKLDHEQFTKEYKELIEWLEKDPLNEHVEKVEISERLTDSPSIVVATTYGMSGNMERIMKAQAYQRGEESMQNYQSNKKKILEINPSHPLIKHLKRSLEKDKELETTRKLAHIIYDTALLRSGYTMPHVKNFTTRVDEIIRERLGISIHEPIEEDDEILEDPAPVESEAATPTESKENVDVNNEG